MQNNKSYNAVIRGITRYRLSTVWMPCFIEEIFNKRKNTLNRQNYNAFKVRIMCICDFAVLK